MIPKLQKSKEKREALLQATLHLINQGGIQEASMSKVAKQAKVSPGTIYLYFENKQDLVNQLYLSIKADFSEEAFKDFNKEEPVKESFEKVWYRIAQFKTNKSEEASFLNQCDNTPMIDEQSRQEGLKHLQPLLDLWIRGQEEGLIKKIPLYLLYAFTIYPMAFLMNTKNSTLCKIDEQILEKAFEAAWDSIKL